MNEMVFSNIKMKVILLFSLVFGYIISRLIAIYYVTRTISIDNTLQSIFIFWSTSYIEKYIGKKDTLSNRLIE